MRDDRQIHLIAGAKVSDLRESAILFTNNFVNATHRQLRNIPVNMRECFSRGNPWHWRNISHWSSSFIDNSAIEISRIDLQADPASFAWFVEVSSNCKELWWFQCRMNKVSIFLEGWRNVRSISFVDHRPIRVLLAHMIDQLTFSWGVIESTSS